MQRCLLSGDIENIAKRRQRLIFTETAIRPFVRSRVMNMGDKGAGQKKAKFAGES
jgi:hypothetical protein